MRSVLLLEAIDTTRARSPEPEDRAAPSPWPALARCGYGGSTSSRSSSTIIVSQTSRAGWLAGMLSISKLYLPISIFRPEDRFESEIGEDLADLIDHLGDRMHRADQRRPARQGNVDAFPTPVVLPAHRTEGRPCVRPVLQSSTCLTWLAARPTSGRCSAGSCPIPRRTAVISPVGPR